MGKKMDSKAARRIQSYANKIGKILDFKDRLQRTAVKNERKI